jgi:hypothetical protein
MPRILLLAAVLAIAACAERPRVDLELGSQRVQDCVPGSLSRPCP